MLLNASLAFVLWNLLWREQRAKAKQRETICLLVLDGKEEGRRIRLVWQVSVSLIPSPICTWAGPGPTSLLSKLYADPDGRWKWKSQFLNELGTGKGTEFLLALLMS